MKLIKRDWKDFSKGERIRSQTGEGTRGLTARGRRAGGRRTLGRGSESRERLAEGQEGGGLGRPSGRSSGTPQKHRITVWSLHSPPWAKHHTTWSWHLRDKTPKASWQPQRNGGPLYPSHCCWKYIPHTPSKERTLQKCTALESKPSGFLQVNCKRMHFNKAKLIFRT